MLCKRKKYVCRVVTAVLCGIVTAVVLGGLCGSSALASDATASDEAASPASQHAGSHDLGHGNAGKSLEDASEFKSDLAIYTFVVFGLLMLILGKFAWPPISKALEAREKHIADNIAAAEATHEDAKKVLEKHEVKLAGAADEVRGLLEEARRGAEHTKVQIVAEAKSAARAEHDRAMRDIDNATDAAKRQLAEQSADLIVQLAGKVIQETITPEHQSRVVREALSQFVSNN